MSSQGSEDFQLLWQHIDPSTKDTLMADSVQQVSKCVSMEQFHKCTVVLFRITGTGTIQQATLYAATSVAGAGLTAIKSSGSTECTHIIGTAIGTNADGALGARGVGMIVFDVSHDELEGTLADANFITVKASFTTATDELGVLYILSEPRYKTSGLTSTGTGTTA